MQILKIFTSKLESHPLNTKEEIQPSASSHFYISLTLDSFLISPTTTLLGS